MKYSPFALFLFALLALSSKSALAQPLVDIGIFNEPANSNTLVVKIRPTGPFTGNYSGAIFTIRWLNSYGVSLGTATSTFGITKDIAGEVVSGIYRYQTFSQAQTNNVVWDGSAIIALTVPHTGNGSGIGIFEIVNDAWTGSNNGDHYEELNGDDRTGIIYQSSASSPLPVELVSFTAQSGNTSIFLDWKTATEINLDGYQLERSEDGSRFESIAWVAGEGDGSSYQYVDSKVRKGQLYYYRLKMEDWDEQFEYSPIRTGRIAATITFSVYPNPAKDMLWVNILSDTYQDFKLTLSDLSGRLIKEQDLGEIEGELTLPIDLNGLMSGTYLVTVVGGNKKVTEKVVVE